MDQVSAGELACRFGCTVAEVIKGVWKENGGLGAPDQLPCPALRPMASTISGESISA